MGKPVDSAYISRQTGIITKENGNLINPMGREKLPIKTILLTKEIQSKESAMELDASYKMDPATKDSLRMMSSKEQQLYFQITGNTTKENGDRTLLMGMESILGPMVIVMLAITRKEKETAMELCITITEISSQGCGGTD